MDLILDGDLQAIDTSGCANLAELVAHVEALSASAEKRIVVGVGLDGRTLSADELGALEAVPLEGVERIEIERRPARELAQSVLSQSADYTRQILTALDRVVDHYRGSRSDLGNDLLVNVTDSLSVLTGITASVAGVLPEAAEELGRLQGELTPWLEEMIEAQTEEDPIRIADVLAYEIRPRIEGWGTLMQGLAEGLDGVGGGAVSS